MKHPIIRRNSQLGVNPSEFQSLVHNTTNKVTQDRRASQLAREIDSHPHRNELLQLVKAQLRDLSQERVVYTSYGR